MSLLPLLFSNWWEDLEHPHHLPGQHFATELDPHRIMESPLVSRFYNHPLQTFRNYYRPWSGRTASGDAGLSVVKPDKDKFQVSLDVQHFTPDEVKVKVVDNYVVVEGRHEEKRDEHGFIQRQFVRKYLVPEQCDVDNVTSTLSSDGVLTLTAPRKQESQKAGERFVAIERTGKPALVGVGTTSISKEQGISKATKGKTTEVGNDEGVLKNGDE